MDAVRLTTTPGYIACACCGQDIIGIPGDKCDGCRNGDGEGAGEGCDLATAWHCYTAHCDGTGCTYPGECEETEETFRDYYAWDRVKISEVSPFAPGTEASVTVGRLDTGEVCVKPDGWDRTVNLSPVYVAPISDDDQVGDAGMGHGANEWHSGH